MLRMDRADVCYSLLLGLLGRNLVSIACMVGHAGPNRYEVSSFRQCPVLQ